MKKLTINAYSFDELGAKEKQKVLENYAFVNVEDDIWYENTYEDAQNIGLKITGFDLDRANCCTGELLYNCDDIAERIIKEHGKQTDTYKTAVKYLADLKALELKFPEIATDERDGEDLNDEPRQQAIEELNEGFENDLLDDYLSLLKQEYEYQTSEESIKGFIEANDILFAKNGSALQITYHMKDSKVEEVFFGGESCELK